MAINWGSTRKKRLWKLACSTLAPFNDVDFLPGSGAASCVRPTAAAPPPIKLAIGASRRRAPHPARNGTTEKIRLFFQFELSTCRAFTSRGFYARARPVKRRYLSFADLKTRREILWIEKKISLNKREAEKETKLPVRQKPVVFAGHIFLIRPSAKTRALLCRGLNNANEASLSRPYLIWKITTITALSSFPFEAHRQI